jgi:hypothetical protein
MIRPVELIVQSIAIAIADDASSGGRFEMGPDDEDRRIAESF